MAKEEIARVEEFLLLSLCFQKAVCCRLASESVYMRGRVKRVHQVMGITHLDYEGLKRITYTICQNVQVPQDLSDPQNLSAPKLN